MFGDPTPEDVWQARSTWLERVEESSRHPDASYLLSAQGTLITCDIQNAFCAGAWVSVIVLAHAAIDATIRDTEIGDYASSPKKIFGGDPDLEWLRELRNRFIHVREDPADGPLADIDIGDLDIYHDALESSARRAVELLFRTIYASPGT
jgi:hypothetical protein